MKEDEMRDETITGVLRSNLEGIDASPRLFWNPVRRPSNAAGADDHNDKNTPPTVKET